jgi:signal transduction histidine kinase
LTHSFLLQFSLIAGTGCLALALLVLQQNPGGLIHRKFSQLSMALALWNIGYYLREMTQSSSWDFLLFMGTFSIPGSAFDFGSAYLKSERQNWVRRTRFAIYLIGLLFYLTIFMPIFDWQVWNIAALFFILPTLTFALWRLKRRLDSTHHPIQKRQLQVLFYGGCIAALFSPTDLLYSLGVPIPRLGSVATVVYLYFVATGILRYHLLDLQEVMQREQMAAIGEMSAGLAHEVRNPLATIKGAVQYLDPKKFSGEEREFLEIILEETHRLNDVVARFLDYARPLKKELTAEPIDQLVGKAVGLIRRGVSSEQVVAFKVDVSPVALEVDRGQLGQVLINLLTNAIEAMPEGGLVEIIGRPQGERFLLSVRDTGKGIAPEMRAKLFHPFSTSKEKGVGLGLAICRRIIEGHGGAIRVESPKEGGTLFTIDLPLRQCQKGA